MDIKNREASSKNMADALKAEIEKIQKSNVELVQMLSKHQEESSSGRKIFQTITNLIFHSQETTFKFITRKG